MNPALWHSLRTSQRLPSQSWYFIAATTLAVLNRPDEIPRVFRHAIDHCRLDNNGTDRAAELTIARRMREALVKASAVGGLAKTINALLALKTETPDQLLDLPPTPSPTARRQDLVETPPATTLERGKLYFDRNYGKIAGRVMNQMELSGTEDLGVVARLLYGHILSNANILSPVETSYVLIAGLIPQDVNPQLKGHLRGALNHGATFEEVQAVRDAAISISTAAGMERLGDGAVGGWGWKQEIANITK
ncbi:hypothetical protein CLAIMM_11267 [Cladophialophora immunda]|nr:hypothetical protein CLAIMM_11267 [Cladophialophora immunda]